MVADNPAGRLHDILSKAKTANINGNSLETWATFFGLPVPTANNPEGDLEIFHRLAELTKLVDETEEKLKAIENINHELYLRPFGRIRRSIPGLKNVNESFLNLLGNITEGDMTVLEFASIELSKHHEEVTVDEDELNKIKKEVDELFEEVRNADIPPLLRTFMLQQLEVIRRGIQEYFIRGPERLREALAHLLGNYWMKGDVVDATPDDKTVGKFKKVLNGFVSLVTFSLKLQPLLDTGMKVYGFLHGTHGNPPSPPTDPGVNV